MGELTMRIFRFSLVILLSVVNDFMWSVSCYNSDNAGYSGMALNDSPPMQDDEKLKSLHRWYGPKNGHNIGSSRHIQTGYSGTQMRSETESVLNPVQVFMESPVVQKVALVSGQPMTQSSSKMVLPLVQQLALVAPQPNSRQIAPASSEATTYTGRQQLTQARYQPLTQSDNQQSQSQPSSQQPVHVVAGTIVHPSNQQSVLTSSQPNSPCQQGSYQSVQASAQQLPQAGFQSAAQAGGQSLVKPHEVRLSQIGSRVFSGTGTNDNISEGFFVPRLRSSENVVKPVQLTIQPIAQALSEQLELSFAQFSNQPSSKASGAQPVQSSYQSVSEVSSQQPLQASYQSVVQTSSLSEAQHSGNHTAAQSRSQQLPHISYQSVSQAIGRQPEQCLQQRVAQSSSHHSTKGTDVQRVQASLVSTTQTSTQQRTQASYQSVDHSSSQKPAQASYASVTPSISPQLAQVSSLSVNQSSRQKPAQEGYISVNQSSSPQSAKPGYLSVAQSSSQQSAKAGYLSVPQSSSQQTAQASYPSVDQSISPQLAQVSSLSVAQYSSQQSAKAGYLSVTQSSSQQPAQASYPSVVPSSRYQVSQGSSLSMVQPSRQQSATSSNSSVAQSSRHEAAFESVAWSNGQKPAIGRYPSGGKPVAQQPAQVNMQLQGKELFEIGTKLYSCYEVVSQPGFDQHLSHFGQSRSPHPSWHSSPHTSRPAVQSSYQALVKPRPSSYGSASSPSHQVSGRPLQSGFMPKPAQSNYKPSAQQEHPSYMPFVRPGQQSNAYRLLGTDQAATVALNHQALEKPDQDSYKPSPTLVKPVQPNYRPSIRIAPPSYQPQKLPSRKYDAQSGFFSALKPVQSMYKAQSSSESASLSALSEHSFASMLEQSSSRSQSGFGSIAKPSDLLVSASALLQSGYVYPAQVHHQTDSLDTDNFPMSAERQHASRSKFRHVQDVKS